jgi:Na+-transporting NADH:ubiquinone oxidoreductase subunit F
MTFFVTAAGLLILIGSVLISIFLIYILNPVLSKRKVKISVNHVMDLEVMAGSTLIKTLADQRIFLPSSCGGNGICGMCHCKVSKGGGPVLPIEASVFTKEELADNWRLGCQVKVKRNLSIELPEEIFGIKQWECEVVSNRNVSTFIKELVMKLPEGQTITFKSGSYIQLKTPEIEIDFARDIQIDQAFKAEWDRLNVWSLKMKNSKTLIKPYSLANPPAEANIVMLNARISLPPWDNKSAGFAKVSPGISSSYIFSRKPGDKVLLSGPYGDFYIKSTQREMMFIAGGAGMAPIRSHLFHLFHTEKTDRKTTCWFGGRSLKELFYIDDFTMIQEAFPNFTFHVALSEPKPDDNWQGNKGFIHQIILDNYLKQHPEPQSIEYYLCGPPMMNTAVLKMLADLGVPDEMIAFDDFGS